MKTISLCIIVKNESHVIERCLRSVKPLVDYVLIVDTGSTDNTIEVARLELLKLEMMGEVVQDTWENFAKNRTSALEMLRSREFVDYALMIDADEVLQFDDDFDITKFKSEMDCDIYDITTRMGNITYSRPQLTSNKMEFRYEGVLHEFLVGGSNLRKSVNGFWNLPVQDSHRNKSADKYQKDSELLKKAIETEQDDWMKTRYTFYLAQSLRDSGNREESLEYYIKRGEMGHWGEERFISYFNVGNIMKELDYPPSEVIQSYMKGHEILPTRVECIWGALNYCRLKGLNQQGWILGQEAIKITKPNDGLFIENWIYDYGVLDEFSIVSFWAGHFQQSKEACERLLEENKIPHHYYDRVKSNLQFALDRLC